jgi:outer membrane protein OmpA-like peptidoglycan-associated protein
MPLELYEARNAIQSARSSGADKYASETFQKAESNLKQAEAYRARNAGSKPVTMTARQAVQTAEDARAIAVKRQDDEFLANERRTGAERETRAENGRVAAQSETDRVTREAAEARLKAQAEADRVKRDNDAQTVAAQTEADRLKRDNEGRLAAAQTEADRLKRENDARSAASQTEADRLRRENDEQRAASQTELDRVAREKRQLETEKTELRAQLLLQFNAILQTRDTARGLVVNMSDVLFDTGKYSLRPEAREKLAKVAGIVSGHPGLRLDVEGNTDSVGGDDYNQKLSEERGGSVRDYLVQQGMAGSSVSSKGFGKNQPIASNDTASGRQQNRRVELVISGEIIGKVIGVPIASR